MQPELGFSHFEQQSQTHQCMVNISLPPEFNFCPSTERNIIYLLLFECAYESFHFDKQGGQREEENSPGKGLQLIYQIKSQ